MAIRVLRQAETEQRSEPREKLAAAIQDLRDLEAEIAAIKDAIAATEAAPKRWAVHPAHPST
jgi:hypothetical protein